VAVPGVLLAVAVAQLGDVVTFVRMVAIHGWAAELNPLVHETAALAGFPGLILVKLAVVVLVASTFAILARSHGRLAAAVAAAGVVAGILGATSNVLASSGG
jgi:hypothetical protein